MTKRRILIRSFFLAATVAVLGTAYALAKQSGLLNNAEKNQPSITDPWKILQQIHLYYERNPVFGQTYDIRLYSEKEPGVILEQYNCVYYSGNGKVYSSLGPGETYCDKDMLISADLENKVIDLAPLQPELLALNLPALKELKKLVGEMKGQLNVIEENGKQVLTFKTEFDTEIKSYRVSFNPVTWAITTVKIEIWKEGAFLQKDPEILTMDIGFGALKTLDNFPEQFGRNRFLRFNSDTISLQPDYLDFELINQLNLPGNN